MVNQRLWYNLGKPWWNMVKPPRQLQRACFIQNSGVSWRSWHRSAAAARPKSGQAKVRIENVWGLISSRVHDSPQPTNLDHLCQKNDEAAKYSNSHCNYYSEILDTCLNNRFLSVVTKKGVNIFYLLFFRGTRPLLEKIWQFWCSMFANRMFLGGSENYDALCNGWKTCTNLKKTGGQLRICEIAVMKLIELSCFEWSCWINHTRKW